jgi:hypothetical protein
MTDIERLRDILAKIESYGDYSTRGARLSECYVAAYTFLRDRGHALLADMERRAVAPDDAASALQFLRDAISASTTESDAETAVAPIRRLLADYERLRGMEERVKGAVVRKVGECCGHAIVADDYYGDEEVNALNGQLVALVPVPGGE